MKVGDIVVLKSGSWEMTVERVRTDGRLICVWFDQRQKFRRSAFPAAVLRAMPQ